jgi:hypothetical protein
MIDQLSTPTHSNEWPRNRSEVSESVSDFGLASQRAGGIQHKVLEHLPLPVIAVDHVGRVTLANRRARTLTGGISPGRMLFEFFPDTISGRVSVAIATGNPKTIRDCTIGSTRFSVDCVPVPPTADDPTSGVLILIPG